jgi:hypothetical protein
MVRVRVCLVQIANRGRSGVWTSGAMQSMPKIVTAERSSGVSQGLTAENSIVVCFSVLFCSCRSILVPTRANERGREP